MKFSGKLLKSSYLQEKYKITFFSPKNDKNALTRKIVSKSKKNIIFERFKQIDIFVFRFLFIFLIQKYRCFWTFPANQYFYFFYSIYFLKTIKKNFFLRLKNLAVQVLYQLILNVQLSTASFPLKALRLNIFWAPCTCVV